MRATIVIGIIAVCLSSCNQSTSPSDNLLNATFILTDTLGNATSQFHSGEEFMLIFSVTNTTRDTIMYYRGSTAPPVTFQIVQRDSVIASSTDGYAFLTVVLGGFLPPGQILQGDWKAPATPHQNPKVILSPGLYEAKVLFPNFNQVTTHPVAPITLSIVQ